MSEQNTVEKFHHLFHSGYRGQDAPWLTTKWLGVPVQKCPMDLMMYQEIIYETRPELIVECGTNAGGSALFLASVCQSIGHGEVLTCDITYQNMAEAVRNNKRITTLKMSSTSQEFLEFITDTPRTKSLMLILDSDHSKDHVLQELRLLAPLVTPGCYLIVEDTNMNGNPIMSEFGPGPKEALEEYLADVPGMWEVDSHRERMLMTFNPGGYLRRTNA